MLASYDALGRRVRLNVNGNDTYYVYNGDHVIAEHNGSGRQLCEFVNGPWVDKPISMLKTSNSTRCFYFQDGLGSISEALDIYRTVKEQYEHTPFGVTTVKTGAGVVKAKTQIGNPYAFMGRRLDYTTGLYYLSGARVLAGRRPVAQ